MRVSAQNLVYNLQAIPSGLERSRAGVTKSKAVLSSNRCRSRATHRFDDGIGRTLQDSNDLGIKKDDQIILLYIVICPACVPLTEEGVSRKRGRDSMAANSRRDSTRLESFEVICWVTEAGTGQTMVVCAGSMVLTVSAHLFFFRREGKEGGERQERRKESQKKARPAAR